MRMLCNRSSNGVLGSWSSSNSVHIPLAIEAPSAARICQRLWATSDPLPAVICLMRTGEEERPLSQRLSQSAGIEGCSRRLLVAFGGFSSLTSSCSSECFLVHLRDGLGCTAVELMRGRRRGSSDDARGLKNGRGCLVADALVRQSASRFIRVLPKSTFKADSVRSSRG